MRISPLENEVNFTKYYIIKEDFFNEIRVEWFQRW